MKNYKNSMNRPRHGSGPPKILFLACIIAVLTCLISVIAYVVFINSGTTAEEPEIPEAEELPPPIETPSLSGNNAVSEPEKAPIVYPDPEYNLTLEEIYVPMEGLSREYRIAWVSDLHMITDHEPKPGGISDGSLVKVIIRYNNLSVTADGVHAEDLWPEIIKCLNKGNYDAVIFGGDMIDYCSTSNMEVLKKGFDELRYEKDRILYIRSDHDYGAWYVGSGFTQLDIYDLHKELDGDDLEKKYVDMGEFVLIGINNSVQNMTKDYFLIVNAQYENAARENKPIIAVTHVPYGSTVDSSLEELSMSVRNKEYYWLGEWQPNETMQKYLELLYSEDTKVKQVLAGHLHAPWDGMITNQLRQHIFSPAFSGTIGVIHFVPEGTDADTSTYHTRKYYP